MSGYLSEARRHAEKIKYYHEYADSSGYSQALDHFKKISSLALKANYSQKHSNDAPFIHSIMKEMQKLMDEMQERAE